MGRYNRERVKQTDHSVSTPDDRVRHNKDCPQEEAQQEEEYLFPVAQPNH